jgi:hypothetical protein
MFSKSQAVSILEKNPYFRRTASFLLLLTWHSILFLLMESGVKESGVKESGVKALGLESGVQALGLKNGFKA